MTRNEALQILHDNWEKSKEMLRDCRKRGAHETTVNYWDGKQVAYGKAIEIVERIRGRSTAR